MAKKKKSKKKGSRRRRGRLGSTAGERFTGALMVMGGAALSRTIDAVLPDDMDIDPKIIAGGKMAVAIFAPTMFKDPKTRRIAEQVGDGMLAVAGMEMLDAFGFFEGVGLPKMSKNRMSEADDVEELAVVIEGLDEMNDEVINDGINVMNEDVLAEDVLADDYEDFDDDDEDEDDLMD